MINPSSNFDTSAPIGAWKCKFPPIKEIIKDLNVQETIQPTDGHKIS